MKTRIPSFLPLLLWGCTSHPVAAPSPQPEQETRQKYEVNPIRDVDILFVIDSSPSMKEEQEELKANFDVFMTELEKIQGASINIGVITPDLGAGVTTIPPPPAPTAICRPGGEQGLLKANPGCGLNPGAKFIEFGPGRGNFSGNIRSVFQCLANVGTSGCHFEHQLEATRVALTRPENASFLRKNAFLAIIHLTDEDDCSADANSDLFSEPMDKIYMGATASFRCAQQGHVCRGMQPPIGDYMHQPYTACTPSESGRLIPVKRIVDAIRALKAEPDRQIIVAGIFGLHKNPETAIYQYAKRGGSGQGFLDYLPIPGCDTDATLAFAAIRMQAFVDAFGTGNAFSICGGTFAPAIQKIGAKVAQIVGTPCVNARLVDVDPAKAGLQAECEVTERVPGSADVVLPPCSAGGGRIPCWDLIEDRTICTASGFKIGTNRGGKMAPQGATQTISCATCPALTDPKTAAPGCK